jgi:hypothetical protein
MSVNAIALRFTDRATAYQALTGLKHLTSVNAEVSAAILVERFEDGTTRFTEGMDGQAQRGWATDDAADLLAPKVPPEGTAIFARVREVNTETLDLLALWYGAVLERRPADEVFRDLKLVEGGADAIGQEEARGGRDRERADAGARPGSGIAMVRRMSAA